MTHRLLLDVSSMFYRSYFAMREPGVFAKDGRSVSALHGYLDTKGLADRMEEFVAYWFEKDAVIDRAVLAEADAWRQRTGMLVPRPAPIAEPVVAS